MANVNSNEQEDLSITLIERRKRLHDLANEINRWEDDSAVSHKKYTFVLFIVVITFIDLTILLKKIEKILRIYHKHTRQPLISQTNHRHLITFRPSNIIQVATSHH
jgi:hypothetical protein